MALATISSRFQVVIPRDVRDQLGLAAGQKLQAFAFENRIEFIPVRSACAMRGFLRGIDTTTIGREGDRHTRQRRDNRGRAPAPVRE